MAGAALALDGRHGGVVPRVGAGPRSRPIIDADHAACVAIEIACTLKAAFAANLGRETKAPLDTITALTRCLATPDRHSLSDGDIIDCARLIEESARRLASFIAGITDLATLESANVPLKIRDLRLDGVLMAAIAAHEAAAAEGRVRLTSSIPAELPPVPGDAARLFQVFNHVLGHAVAASPPGGAVRIEALATSTGGIAVFVRDSGCGTSAEAIARALRPLGYLDSSRVGWRDGANLDLKVAAALVELHGGRLAMASVEGEGTEVMVALPPARRARAAREIERRRGASSSAGGGEAGPRWV